MFLNSSDWLVRMRPVSTILFRAAEGTKSRANNLISDHFWYIDINKHFFLVSMRHILKPLFATMSVKAVDTYTSNSVNNC